MMGLQQVVHEVPRRGCHCPDTVLAQVEPGGEGINCFPGDIFPLPAHCSEQPELTQMINQLAAPFWQLMG